MGLDNLYGLGSLRPGVCTSTSRPGAPFEGQLIYETDTDLVQGWNGSGWKSLGNLKASTNSGVLQVVQTVKTDTFSTTTLNTWTDITGLSVTITPSSTSSKILLLGDVNVSGSNYFASGVSLRLTGGNSGNYVGDAAGSRIRSFGRYQTNSAGGYVQNGYFAPVYLDSPATTSATTYKMQLNFYNPDGGGHAIYVNRSWTDSDTTAYSRTPSSITAIEISG